LWFEVAFPGKYSGNKDILIRMLKRNVFLVLLQDKKKSHKTKQKPIQKHQNKET
jgi:hypothetical protein